jgi:hypothetical protein
VKSKEENSQEFCLDFAQEFGLSSILFLGAVYTLVFFSSTPDSPLFRHFRIQLKFSRKIELFPASIMVFLNHSSFISFCINRSFFLLPRTSNSICFLPVKSRSAHAPHIKDWILFISVSFHLYFQRDISFKICSHPKPKAQSSYNIGRKKITSFITCFSVVFHHKILI